MINKPGKNINSRPVANVTKISSGRPILHVAGDLQNLFGTSDFPTAFLGPNVKKALHGGEISNRVVIKLFVKIINESFFK